MEFLARYDKLKNVKLNKNNFTKIACCALQNNRGQVFMTSARIVLESIESMAVEFFQQTEGKWKSQRRYYTLKTETEPQEVVSAIEIEFLDRNTLELLELAKMHELDLNTPLLAGTKVTWESNYTNGDRKSLSGSTVFGVLGNTLYRDRGFATNKPVTAIYSFTNPQTMCLRTEYLGSVFEEEIKLIGKNYRTRQTIISKAGQELTIGQYLEQRID
jgi:predicted transposase YbfD/YdcC